MLLDVTRVEARGDYRLYLEFEDGTRGELDVSTHIWGPVFEPVRDPAEFARVKLDGFGSICWPNGADLAPETLYDELKQSLATQPGQAPHARTSG